MTEAQDVQPLDAALVEPARRALQEIAAVTAPADSVFLICAFLKAAESVLRTQVPAEVCDQLVDEAIERAQATDVSAIVEGLVVGQVTAGGGAA